MGDTSYARAINRNLPREERRYNVYVNLNDPIVIGRTSSSLIESARIHERTHVSADQSYTFNTPGVDMQIHHSGYASYHQYPIYDRAERLLRVIRTDNALSKTQRQHLYDRNKKNSVGPIEWDPTINELLVYTRYEGIRANSNTVKLLVQYANENLQHRRGNIDRLPRLTTRSRDRYHEHYDGWKLVMAHDN